MFGEGKWSSNQLKHLWGERPMPYSKEWQKRFKWWMGELLRHFYTPLGSIELAGFTTKEQLSYDEALKGEFRPMPAGTKWGQKWEYAWFKGSICLPQEAAGRRIVILPDMGGEGLVFVNGIAQGSKDYGHDEITLTKCGVPGEIYDIVIESYAGHGPRIENIGPTPPGRIAVPEPPKTQVRVGQSSFGVWEEEAYQLFLDVSTLYKVLICINEKSLRAQEIAKGLRDFTLIVDFEQPYQERVASFKKGRERLKPLLECVNGSTAPLMYIFGQSHLDLAWLWPKAETERKSGRTLATQMALMDEYPNYRFFMTQPPLFEMIKEHYPSLHDRILGKVESGQIMPEGGMWVESDTNLPSGESLVRQLLYGKRYFRETFGIDSKLVWLPDCFGFSAALPQIMAGCGIRYFSTQKLLRFYNDGDPFPFNIFMWEGIDGTQILSHIHKKNNSHIDPEMLIERWENDRNQEEDISTFIFPFGYGDGGGGPTRYHLEYVNRLEDLEGVPRTKMSHPNDFFQDIEERGLPRQTYVGELYFQAHRGTYTSQAKTKKGNRKSEFALREAEFWLTVSQKLANDKYPYVKLEGLWKKVLFNQFHDVLPGTSITRVHREAEEDYATVISQAGDLTNRAVACLLNTEDQVSVFNSLSWTREELIALPEGAMGAKTPDGELLPVQIINDQPYTKVKVPACGLVSLQLTGEAKDTRDRVLAEKHLLENDYLRVSFNDHGQITSIFDKESGLELTKGLCNEMKMYKDVTTAYDAWDLDSMYEDVPVALDHKASMEVMYEGCLVAGLRVRRRLNHSEMTQEITLRSESRRVDFKTTIDWQEDHKLLKVNFPVNIEADEAFNEIQFGYVKRPTHKSRQYDADRFEVCNHKWTALAEARRGFAILNDSKYGVNVADGSINLTLLKAPLVPDMYADRGLQEFTYSFYVWNGSFADSRVAHEAYELNSPVFVRQGGVERQEGSFFRVDSDGIILDTVKLAEDQSGDIILRLYESVKTTTTCQLSTTLPIVEAVETNMLEETKNKLALHNGSIQLVFRPFEIKTVRLKTKN